MRRRVVIAAVAAAAVGLACKGTESGTPSNPQPVRTREWNPDPVKTWTPGTPTVVEGAVCNNIGAYGRTAAGKNMRCRRVTGEANGKWRAS